MFKDLLVFIPGITGSLLEKDGEMVWGPSLGVIMRALRDRKLECLRLSSDDGRDDLGDGIRVAGLMPDAHMIPGFWKIDGYTALRNAIGDEFALSEKRGNLLLFPYDWRRDNRVTARRLAREVDAALKKWRASSGNPDANLIIAAHSMGGLIARYFIECLEGWRITDRLITLGTPFRGSLNAVGFLANGAAKDIGPLHFDATETLRSFPSVYQLLPTYSCVDNGAGDLASIAESAIAGIDPAKALDARAFHTEIAAAATANAKLPDYQPAIILPVLSSTQPTIQSASLAGGKVVLHGNRQGKDQGGDGTVPMVSAIPAGQKAHDGIYVRGIHGSLQTLPVVHEFLFGQMRSTAVDLDKLRGPPLSGGIIRLALGDVYAADTPIEIAAELRNAGEQTLKLAATSINDRRLAQTVLRPDGSGRFAGAISLAPGTWRVTVAGQASQPVSDIISVIDA